MDEIRGTQHDASITHLLNIIDGGREQRQKEADAVNTLLAQSDPSHRQPSHRQDSAVMFLAGLTQAELRRQNGGR